MAITNALKFQVILDEDPNTRRIYPRVNGKLLGVEESIPFISDDPRLFRIKTLQISHDSFVNQTGLDLWHRRLGHVANESIIQTVAHSFGISNIPKTMPRGINCPECMIGKCQRRNAPSLRKERAKAPLEQVNWDLMMVNELSIENYCYAMIITDSFSGLTWVYGPRIRLCPLSKSGTVILLHYGPNGH